jgi:hypothetical protein
MGRAADSRRTADARDRGGRINRRQVPPEAGAATIPRLEEVSLQSCFRNRVDRSVRRANDIVQAALWFSDSASRSAAAGYCQRDLQSDAERIAGQVTDAFRWDESPQHLIRDRDAVFGPAYTRRIRAMGIRDHPTAPRSPWQNGHVERLIGSICRECLDHVIVFGEVHLRRVLKTYASYYNQVRTHLSLDKNTPDFRRPLPVGAIAAIPILGGLHHQYVRH